MRSLIATSFLAAGVGLSACATAPQLSPPASTAMPAGTLAQDSPLGFVSFCLRFKDQCAYDANTPSVVTLDSKTWTLANQVNASLNADIWPEHDKRHYDRTEYWTIPTDGFGDCKDYALAKRKELAEKGLPLRALRVALVMTPDKELHAVLTIATDKGDYALDNLTDTILPWNATDYRWIARQDSQKSWDWVSFDNKSTRISMLETEAGSQLE
jgi:predicted transglutaminase-like cysteine proteinase